MFINSSHLHVHVVYYFQDKKDGGVQQERIVDGNGERGGGWSWQARRHKREGGKWDILPAS